MATKKQKREALEAKRAAELQETLESNRRNLLKEQQRRAAVKAAQEKKAKEQKDAEAREKANRAAMAEVFGAASCV